MIHKLYEIYETIIYKDYNIKNVRKYISQSSHQLHKLSQSQYIQICRLSFSRPCKKTTFLYQGHHRLYQQN